MKRKLTGFLLVAIACISIKTHAQTYNVGVGGTYTTLEDAITAYNSMVLTQPVIFNLTDEEYNPPADITIQKNASSNSSNTLTVKPAAGITTTINGNVFFDAFIKIIGDNIIIDGSNNGTSSRNLFIVNNSTIEPRVFNIGGAALATSVSNITIKNTVLINGNQNFMALSLSAPAGVTTDGYFNNVTIQNNSIRRSKYGINVLGASGGFQNGTTIKLLDNDLATVGNDAIQNIGIFVSGLSFGCTISGNIIGNFPITTTEINKGIWISTACSTLVVKNNIISGISYNGFLFNASNAPIGIDISSNGGFDIIIDGNLVSDISAATGGIFATGISLAGSSSTVTIKNNQVSNITNSSFLGNVIGISHNPTSAGGINALFNNFIYDVHADGANGASYGIYMGPTEGFRQINHNNVLLTDPEGVSYAFYIDAPSNNRGSCRNNNFINRSASPFDSYAIFQANSNSAFLVDGINYNNVEGTPLAAYNNEVLTTLAAVQTMFGANTVNIPPVFVSNTNLHIATSGNAGLDNKGTPIATITTDIDGDARSSVSPDIGADEFGNITEAALIISCTAPATVFCPGATFNLSYVVQGTPNPGNIYTAELSNAVGSFTFPVSIGTLTSTATSGVISVTIPATASGSFYRIRVKSSTPAYTGTDNGTDLIIKKPFTGPITGSATAVSGTAISYSVVLRSGSKYVWSFSNGVQNTGGVTNSVTGTFNTAGTQTVSVTETDQIGCPGTTVNKTVTVTLPLTNKWTGNADTDWNNAANWSDNSVPTSTSDVVIPSNMPRYPIISINTTVKSITVETGGTVNVAEGINVIIKSN